MWGQETGRPDPDTSDSRWWNEEDYNVTDVKRGSQATALCLPLVAGQQETDGQGMPRSWVQRTEFVGFGGSVVIGIASRLNTSGLLFACHT